MHSYEREPENTKQWQYPCIEQPAAGELVQGFLLSQHMFNSRHVSSRFPYSLISASDNINTYRLGLWKLMSHKNITDSIPPIGTTGEARSDPARCKLLPCIVSPGSWGDYLGPREKMRMASGEESTKRNFIVRAVHLI